MTPRKKNDEKDRKALPNKLEVCINPLHPEQHMCCEHCHRGVCDLSSSPCDNEIQEGKKQISLFEGSWSAGFHTKILKCSYHHVGDEKTHQCRRHEGV